ncbi:hypothetical protein [Haloferula sp. BvORR071]|nr:hypothetical protein [Haloferula sp. BvORR071]
MIRLSVEELGYRYAGDWRDRLGNSNIEPELLGAHLAGLATVPIRSPGH